jgi:hypothetical protein
MANIRNTVVEVCCTPVPSTWYDMYLYSPRKIALHCCTCYKVRRLYQVVQRVRVQRRCFAGYKYLVPVLWYCDETGTSTMYETMCGSTILSNSSVISRVQQESRVQFSRRTICKMPFSASAQRAKGLYWSGYVQHYCILSHPSYLKEPWT